MAGVSWLIVRSREHIESGVMLTYKALQANWEKYNVARHHTQLVYEDAERAFTEWNKLLLRNAPSPWNW